MRLRFFDSKDVIEGDCVVLQIGRLVVFWMGSAWGQWWHLRLGLADCWFELCLGRISVNFYKGDWVL